MLMIKLSHKQPIFNIQLIVQEKQINNYKTQCKYQLAMIKNDNAVGSINIS